MLRAKLSALLYRFHSMAHWAPRNFAAIEAVRGLQQRGIKGQRIVDLGCGSGQFHSSARLLEMDYLGIEPDPAWNPDTVHLGNANCKIVMGAARDIGSYIKSGDIVLLNGVAHHIDEQEWSDFLMQLGNAHGLVILDHVPVAETSVDIPFLPRILQRFDRGKFIRSRTIFQSLPGWKNICFQEFEIKIAGVTCWPYFVANYEPVKRAN